jgi:hypothetical protein
MKRPLILVWVGIAPQVALLLLNLRDYQLIVGEMTPWQNGMARTIGAAQLGLLTGLTTLAVILRVTGRKISWPVACGLLIAPILFLWLFLYQSTSVIPTSVTAWILPPEQVLYDQFAFLMPLMFYAAVRIACAEINMTRRIDWIVTAGLGIGIPLVLAGFIRWAAGVNTVAHLPVPLIIGIFVFASIVVTAGLLRLVVMAYLGVRRQGAIALGIFSFLVGIAGPIGGLLVNREIPLPADFQALSIYVLALVNGGLLLLPNFRNPLLHRAVWLGQCLLFPFTFYFFLVFLPFLPLSLPAILAVGTGFLMMTPTVLFLVHGQRICDGYRDEIRDGGRIKPAIFALVALSILPGWYVVQAGLDRAVLRQAIDYVYSPNYQKNTQFPGNANLVHRSLEHLRDAKRGRNLPFLSRFYSWVVFDGLVLPDDKMNEIHRAFFGTDVPAVRTNPNGFFSRPAVHPVTRATAAVPHDVRLTKTTAEMQPDGNCHRATVSLQMENMADSVSEFATTIELPEGVLVSGFWLHIGSERVPGQVFEKKTALWVYEMIRDRTQRDPGVLLFTNPHTLELRVYPFASREQRTVEIEFLYPAAMYPTIVIGGEKVRPSGENIPAGIVVTHLGDSGPNVWLGPDTVTTLPKLARTPYLHFLVDRSAGSDIAAESIRHAVTAAQKQFPDARQCLVTLVNYEIDDVANELKPIESASSASLSALPRRGGFMAGRAMKRALLNYHDAFAKDGPDNPMANDLPGVHRGAGQPFRKPA